MKLVKIKCPNCDAPIEIEKEGACKCPNCGASFMAEREDDNIIINTTINNYGQSAYRTPNKKPSKGNKSPRRTIIIIVSSLLVIAVVAFGLHKMLYRTDTGGYFMGPDYTGVYRTVPESTIMRSFVTDVLGGNPDMLTKDDYDRLTEFHIASINQRYDRDWMFEYVLDDNGQVHTWYVDSREYDGLGDISMADFQCFTKLKTLDLAFVESIDGKSVDLRNLTELTTYVSPKGLYTTDLKNFFADGTQISRLGIDVHTSTSRGDKSIEDIAAYTPNVEKLEFASGTYGYESMDVSEIDKLTKLKDISVTAAGDMNYLTGIDTLEGLTLNCSDSFSDFSFLYGMSNLKRLSIKNAKNMRDVGFLDGMDDLEELDIEDSIVTNLDSLTSHHGITSLTLIDNNNISDYSFIESLTELESLTFYDNAGGDNIPSLARLPKLGFVSISGRYIDRLKGSRSLTKLIILSDADLADINNTPQLAEIIIVGGGTVSGFSGLFVYDNLTSITIIDTGIYDNIATLLNTPALETLNIYGKQSSGVLDSLLVKDNDHLKVLHLTGNAGRFVDTSEAYSKLHAIEELTVPGNTLDNLEFVSGTPNLRKLDVSGNYIKDVSPLVELSDLHTLIIKDNSVANMDVLPNSVYVIE